jgi:aminocarboxymuconate-semialdehyde decarboxylase
MRKVDACAHIFPRAFWDKMQARAGRLPDIGGHSSGIPLFTNLDQRFRLMDRFDGYEQILSLTGPALESVFAPDVAIDMARYANDALADLAERHPDRFPGFFAALSITNPDAAMAEIYRAVKDLGALGVQVLANAAGPMLDRADYAAIFRACYDLDVPISLHPAPGADHGMAGLQSHFVFSGLMDDLPGIKIMSPQLGGLTSFVKHRLGPQTLRPLKKPYAEYFKDFYANTALSRARDAVEGGLSYHPRDRMMFATAASDDEAARIREQIQVVEDLDIDAEWKQDIFWRNAAKIMSFDRREESTPVKLRA